MAVPTSRLWPLVSPYLDEALELEADARAVWLASIRARDRELANILDSLLEEHRLLAREKFLEGDGVPEAVANQAETQNVGPYRLISKIGEGGMGSVWLGERADGEIEQRVAVKLLNRETYRPRWRDRFLRERQLLASLNHPSIVRVIDVGHTQEGVPYLVMEYVDGFAIDVYARDITVRERLELFLHVCDAVSHAHQYLIIHRDLKPSNILVDRSGQPKLLDFGIAKLLDATDDRTQTTERLLTPKYASPEQVRGAAQTTATDVYSLGAVLYKVLTNRTPGEQQASGSDGIAPGEMIVAPSRLNPALPSDIDYVLGKALRAEPEERYVSVDAFASDIRALLDWRPVHARSGNAWYRTRKFLHRHWVPTTAVVLVLASLSASLYVAERERVLAQQRFQQVRQLAHKFVFDLHDEIAKLQGSTKAREMVVRTGLEYLDNLARSAGSDLELERDIASAYVKIGDAEGFPTRPNLGRMDDALASYRKAGALYQHIARKNPDYLPDLARFYLQYASLVRFTYDLKGARELSQLAIRTFDQVQSRASLDPESQQNYIVAWCTLGDVEEDLGRYRRSWEDFSRCRELARERLRVNRDEQTLVRLAEADERIGTAAQELGLLTDALQALDEDEAVLDELLAAEPRNPKYQKRRALVDHYRASLYYKDTSASFEDPQRALDYARRYLDREKAIAESDPNDTSAQFSRGVAMFQVSFCLRDFHSRAAITMARNSLRTFEDLIAAGKTNYLISSRRFRAMLRLGEAELKAGEVREALHWAESALAGQQQIALNHRDSSEERVALISALTLAGQANAASANFERAESLLLQARQEADSLARNPEVENVIPLANTERALGNFYVARRRKEEARACFERLVQLWRRFPESNPYVNRQRIAASRILNALHT